MSTNKISFIIPSHNGHDLLKVFLPSLYDTVSKEKISAEIIVVDDASTDSSITELRKLALPVKIVARDIRGGFAKSCNEGAKYASGPFLFFLNNDMTLNTQEEFINPIIKCFDNDDVFAVAPSSLTYWDGKLFDETPTIGEWKKGFLKIDQPGFTPGGKREIFYASGGCMCVRKDRFLTLDGFDELFSPFYFEDVDLCWRARKKGWKILYEPLIRLHHKGHETINRLYNPIESDAVYWKNYFIFIWKNINDPQLCKEHFDHLTEYIFEKSRKGQAALLGCKLAMRLFRSQGHKENAQEIDDKDLLLIVCDE